MRLFLTCFKFASVLAIGAAFGYGQQNLILRAATGQGPTVELKYGLTLVHNLNSSGDVALVVAGDANATQQFLTLAQSDPLIQSVEPDVEKELGESDSSSRAANYAVSGAVDPLLPGGSDLVNYFGNPVRSGYANQPEVAVIHIPGAQAAFGVGSGIVAVIDTGIDPSHPALAGNVINGYDFINNIAGVPSDLASVNGSTVAFLDQMGQPQAAGGQMPFVLNAYSLTMLNGSTVAFLDGSTVAFLDQNNLGEAFGHGTMVSGLIHLVAPGAKIMPLRAFQNDGTGNMSDIVRAIYYATDNGARVINMSFSSTSASPALAAAIQYARAHKVITVSAAGNSGTGVTVYPAGCGAIGVASINGAGLRSFFSNYGDSDARTSAPGEALLTTYPGGGYVGVWGTSFSAALVSGTAAILGQIAPRASQGDFSDALQHGRKLGTDGNIGDASLDVLSVLQGYKADD